MKLMHWRTLAGPLTTLATVAGIYLIDRYVATVPNPGAISFVAVVFSAYIGGIIPGLVSAAISIAYAAFSFSIPGQWLEFKPDNLARLYVLIVGTPAIAVMVGILQARAKGALHREHTGRQQIEAANIELLSLRSALDHLDYGIVLLDRELRAQFINRAFREMWRLPDELADRKPAFVGLMYHGRDTGAYAVRPDEVDAHVARRTAMVRAGDEQPIDIRLANGDVVCVRCKVLPDGGRMLTYANVTDRVKRTDDLEQLATHDGMTGLYNRSHFLEIAAGEWSRFKRYGRPLSVLTIDIDNFKTINDRHGHGAGDRVIVQTAGICRASKRNSDIVARVGGEEFVMLLPETDLQDARAVAERLRKEVPERPLMIDGNTVQVTVSIGVAEASHDTGNMGELLNRADLALYEAKRGGRNQVCVFGDTQTRKSAGGPSATAA
jgi:diguanylate cyclase (GGDEF)-like protein